MQHVLSRAHQLVILAVLAAVIAGCGADGPEDTTSAAVDDTTTTASSDAPSTTTTAAAAQASGSTATFSVDGRSFTVELASCVGSGGDMVLHGPAVENGTGVTGYFGGDITPFDGGFTGEFRIDIGASGQFESSDEFVAMGDAFGELEMSPAGDGWIATGPAWSDDGTDLGSGTVEFTC